MITDFIHVRLLLQLKFPMALTTNNISGLLRVRASLFRACGLRKTDLPPSVFAYFPWIQDSQGHLVDVDC